MTREEKKSSTKNRLREEASREHYTNSGNGYEGSRGCGTLVFYNYNGEETGSIRFYDGFATPPAKIVY